jgi:hypothetical protein
MFGKLGRQNVDVHRERERRRVMAKLQLHLLRVPPVLEQDRPARVAEHVEADPGLRALLSVRDLLAERDGQIEVIQCKRWARSKTIHEKHVFQLFGTVVAAGIENPEKKVTGTFTTTTALSERARKFARALDIRVEENFPLADYPRIKCNVARDGERIYHLPFDQQYDTTIIEPARGEKHAGTVAEAESAGFPPCLAMARRRWGLRSEQTSR